MLPLVVRSPLSVTLKEPPTVDEVTVAEAVSLTLALPPVEALNEAASVLVIVMLPVPELSVNVPVEMSLPLAACVMLPEPPALSVVLVALRLPLTRMSSFEVPVVVRERVEPDVMVLLSVIVPPELRLTEPAVRSPVAVSVVPAVTEAVAVKSSVPADIVPLVARLPLSVTLKEPATVDEVTVAEAVSLTLALPPVEALNDPALVLVIVMSPVPELSVKVPVEMSLPVAAWVMLPEPPAVSVVVVAPRLPLTRMSSPDVPVVVRARLEPEVMVPLSVNVPVELRFTEPPEIVPVVVRLPLSVTLKEPPTVEEVTVAEAVSLTAALPPAEALKEPALVFVIVMSPVPELSVKVPVEISLPVAACVTLPEPPAERVTVPAAPVVRLALTTRLSLAVPLVLSEILPLLVVIVPLSVKVPPEIKVTVPLMLVSVPLSTRVPVAILTMLPVATIEALSVRLPLS